MALEECKECKKNMQGIKKPIKTLSLIIITIIISGCATMNHSDMEMLRELES